MDIQKLIKEAIAKLEKDDKLIEKFMKDPVKTLEAILNIDLPDEQINPIIEGIKAKLNLNDLLGQAKGITDMLGGLGGLLGKK